MNGPRAWIALLCAVVFLCGFASGLLAGGAFRPAPEERGAFADYRERLVSEFDLSPERERALRTILEHYHAELEDLRAASLDGLEDQLAAAGSACAERIRDRVLPPADRPRYDALVAGADLP